MCPDAEYSAVLRIFHYSEISEALIEQDTHGLRRLLNLDPDHVQNWISGYDAWRDPPLIECVLSGYRGQEEDDGKFEMLKVLVKHGADVNAKNKGSHFGGKTAAMCAARRGFLKCLRFLVASGADLSITSQDGETALTQAVTMGETRCVKFLTEHMTLSTINNVNSEGKTALLIAASDSVGRKFPCMQHIIEAGADLDIKDGDGYTALMYAIMYENVQAVTVLLKKGAEHRTVANSGETPLTLAIRCNSLCREVLTLLIESGAHVTEVLHLALRCGSTAPIRLLLHKGADVNALTPSGDSPLMLALQYCRVREAKLLLYRGAVLDREAHFGERFLFLAIEEDFTEGVAFALGRMADVNKAMESGEAPLVLAFRNKSTETVQLLLAKGADANTVTKAGEPVLFLAIEMNSVEMVKLLLEKGADVNAVARTGELTPLMLGIKKGSPEIVTLLLERGADVNSVSKYDETPLCLAIRLGLSRILSLLLQKGALVNQIVKSDTTHLTMCITRQHYTYIPLLLRAGLDPTASSRDLSSLHLLVSRGETMAVHGLVVNGFPPLDLVCDRWQPTDPLFRYPYESVPIPISPLAVAILVGRPKIARYFIANAFFTRYDILRLCWDPEIRRSLKDAPTNHQVDECVEILKILSSSPQSLLNLTLITISSILTQDMVFDPWCSQQEASKFECKPNLKEKVGSLGLPPILQRALLHQTPYSGMCRHS